MPLALRLAPVCAAGALLAAAGCDDAPGPRDPFGAPPVVASFQVTPDAVSVDTAAPTVEVPIDVRVGVAGGEGEVTVRVLVQSVDGDAVIAEGESAGTDALRSIPLTLALPRGAVGNYEVTATTEDATGRAGDRATGVFAFETPALGPPVVAATASDPAPVADGATVTLTAAVGDPDGVENVAYVELRQLDGALLFRLRDDGAGGDAAADDGTYTVRLRVPAGLAPGTYALDVVATDRTGQESAPAEVTFTVG